MIDVLVADDEAPALAELAHLVGADPRVGEVVAVRSGAEALDALSRRAWDAAFLDIHMPGLTGLDLARAVRASPAPPLVVFVTADDSLALEAYEVEAVAYLLKPIRLERLTRAIDRLVEAQEHRPLADDEVIAVTVGSGVRLIRRGDVRWVHAEGDYSRLFVTAEEGHLVRVPISDLAERWADAGFVRVHRSYLVRAAAITAARLGGAAAQVTIGDVAVIPVSRRLAPAVRTALMDSGRAGAER